MESKPKLVREIKEGFFTLIKKTIHQEKITILNIYAPNTGALRFIKQIVLDIKLQINHNTVTVDDFNTLLSPIDRLLGQNLNRKTLELIK